jgi:hypothetical protein
LSGFIIPTPAKSRSGNREARDNQLFSGRWIRWRSLTLAEGFVCGNIILLPLWWVVGLIYYLSFLLLASVVLSEIWRYRKLRLKTPSLAVVALLMFGSYQMVRLLSIDASPAILFQVANWWIFPACWLWYIQSVGVRIRFEVVAWATIVCAIQHLIVWLICQFILPESFFFPPRLKTLYGIVTHQTEGDAFLMPFAFNPYGISQLGIAGLNRCQFFTRHPLHFSIMAGVMSLIALDIKNRRGFWFLLLSSIFLILLSGSRSLWLMLPGAILIHYWLSNQNNPQFKQILYALLAIVSFALLSLPDMTHLFLTGSSQFLGAIDQMRAGSTDTRMEVYRLTWQGIQENPLWGHIEPGRAVGEVFVGLESFILGQLLYINGLVGTLIFAVFWVALLTWLYRTRDDRPLSCFSVFIFYTIASTTLESVYRSDFSALLLLLCIVCRKTNYPKPESL